MIEELARVALVSAVPEHGLKPGDVGTIVHADPEGRGYILEFVGFDGDTIAIVDVPADAVRPLRPNDVPHAREVV